MCKMARGAFPSVRSLARNPCHLQSPGKVNRRAHVADPVLDGNRTGVSAAAAAAAPAAAPATRGVGGNAIFSDQARGTSKQTLLALDMVHQKG